MSGPLAGITILDTTRVVSGPFSTQLLADLGARVIKIEPPRAGDETRAMGPRVGGESAMFLALNRGKESIVLDLHHGDAAEVLDDLVRRVDVVIENFRPGVAKRLRLDYATLASVKPDVIVCSISGYGQDGPGAGRPAYDVIIQALGGGMSLTGEAGRPPVRAGLPIADLAGGLFATIGILAALQERGQTGRGQHVDIALLDCHVSLLSYFASYFLLAGEVTRSVGSGHPSAEPYGAFPTADGHVVIAVYNESFWPLLCKALERPDLPSDERFRTNVARVANRVELRRLLQAIMAQRPTAYWVAALTAVGVPAAPINTIDQALDDVQVRHRGLVIDLNHPLCGALKAVGSPVRLSRHAEPQGRPPPVFGEHTDSVLSQFLDYPEARIQALRASNCVR